MSHYAKVENGIVTEVIVADKNFIESGCVGDPSIWVQTSYNTLAGVHYDSNRNPDGGLPLRGNYAGVGFVYDKDNDVFYPPQPFFSWTISPPTWQWIPPFPKPDDGKNYKWDEASLSWIEEI